MPGIEALRLNYSLYLAESDAGLVVHVADAEPITLSGDFEGLLKLLERVDGTKARDEIIDSLAEELTADRAVELFEFAESRNLIKRCSQENLIQSSGLGRWDRQIRNFTTLQGFDESDALKFQDNIMNSHVLVLGVGGVGGYVALASAMIGIGRLTIADFDSIELSNTSRQVLYTEAEIGQRKVDVAFAELARRAPSSNIQFIDFEVMSTESMIELIERAESANGKIDLVILCADQPRGKLAYFVDEACCSANVPFLMCGPHDFSRVSVGPLVVPGVTESYSNYFPAADLRTSHPIIEEVNSRFVANIMEPYNGIAAKIAMVEAVKYLTGYAAPFVQDHVVDIDTMDWSVSVYDLNS